MIPYTPAARLKLKTYSHLAENRQIPSHYSISTTDLLYQKNMGFTVATPVLDWMKTSGMQATFATQNIKFSDPRQMTYRKYTQVQSEREIFVQGLLKAMEGNEQKINPEWHSTLQMFLASHLFLFEGFHMLSAYLGQLASESRVVIVLAFQTGDDVRRIENFAQCLVLKNSDSSKALQKGKDQWMNAVGMQDLRMVIETLLVTYDWAEAFTAGNLILKPLIEFVVFKKMSQQAFAQGDLLFYELLGSLQEDTQWHREWTAVLVQELMTCDAKNGDVFRKFIEKWERPALAAVNSYAVELLDDENVKNEIQEYWNQWRQQLHL
jgi:toluene monooxygenase system protein E